MNDIFKDFKELNKLLLFPFIKQHNNNYNSTEFRYLTDKFFTQIVKGLQEG